MADILELQLMKVSDLITGLDTHKGVTELRLRVNPKEYYPVRLEGELAPTSFEEIETDRPSVEGTIQSKSAAVLTGLAGTSHASVTIKGKDVVSQTTKTVTLTNVVFTGADGAIQNRSVAGFSLNFQATDIAIA